MTGCCCEMYPCDEAERACPIKEEDDEAFLLLLMLLEAFSESIPILPMEEEAEEAGGGIDIGRAEVERWMLSPRPSAAGGDSVEEDGRGRGRCDEDVVVLSDDWPCGVYWCCCCCCCW